MPDPEAIATAWRASVAAERAGDLKRAESGYRAILRIAPGHPPALRRLAGIGLRYGDTDAAVQLLERALASDDGYYPAKLDLADLKQQAGAFEEAAGLYKSGLAAAQEPQPARLSNYAAVLLKLGRFEAALRACERHRATGVASANVVAYRAQALWELGRDREALALCDPERFVLLRRPETPDGFTDIAAFNAALVAALEDHPTMIRDWDATRRAARGGRVVEDIFRRGEAEPPAIRTFRAMIQAEVNALVAELPDEPRHPFFGRRPERPMKVACWANLMPGQGIQASHIHNLGWLSGVYYPKLPAAIGKDDHAGWLGVGAPGYGIAAKRAPKRRFVRPEEGMMVCFPSYVWHWTEPFEGGEERVSIAFDIA